MKKTSPHWRIAAIHYLIGAFIPGIFIGYLGIYALSFLTFSLGSGYIYFIGQVVLPAIASLIGVSLAAPFVRKRYVITNASRIAYLASLYYIIIYVLGMLMPILLSMLTEITVIGDTSFDVVISVVAGLLGLAVFYGMSRWLIRNDLVS